MYLAIWGQLFFLFLMGTSALTASDRLFPPRRLHVLRALWSCLFCLLPGKKEIAVVEEKPHTVSLEKL